MTNFQISHVLLKQTPQLSDIFACISKHVVIKRTQCVVRSWLVCRFAHTEFPLTLHWNVYQGMMRGEFDIGPSRQWTFRALGAQKDISAFCGPHRQA